ncbi:MAG: uridine kinase [Lachnospiraceae bacterium]|nr:uridine kinase [Lachnospiraceae bacterium]
MKENRSMNWDWEGWAGEAEAIKKLIVKHIAEGKSFILAIDGRSGAGKSTLAAVLQKETGCPVFHMDDYFLRPQQRTAERFDLPGGNVDHERFLSEILLPLKQGKKSISYRPYDCKLQALQQAIEAEDCDVSIVEGSYSCHPALWDYYDFRVFVTISTDGQRKRIIEREGNEKAAMFFERWIPMEEKYFSHYRIEERCDMVLRAER